MKTDESNATTLKTTAEAMLESGMTDEEVSQYLRIQGQYLNIHPELLASILYELGLYSTDVETDTEINTTVETTPVTKTEDTKKKKKDWTTVRQSASGITHGGGGGKF